MNGGNGLEGHFSKLATIGQCRKEGKMRHGAKWRGVRGGYNKGGARSNNIREGGHPNVTEARGGKRD